MRLVFSIPLSTAEPNHSAIQPLCHANATAATIAMTTRSFPMRADDTLALVEEKELLLREDRRLLGRLLGEVIREQVGEEALERIERIRQTAV